MKPGPQKGYRRLVWTAEEDAEIKRLAEQGMDADQIAPHLPSRTARGVQHRLAQLRKTGQVAPWRGPGRVGYSKYDDAFIERVRELRGNGLSWGAIGRALGVHRSTLALLLPRIGEVAAPEPEPVAKAEKPALVTYTDALAWFRANAEPKDAGRYADMTKINALRKAKGRAPFPVPVGGLFSPASRGVWA